MKKKNHICLINVLLFALGRQLYGKMKVNLQTTRLLHLWKFLLFHEFSVFFLIIFPHHLGTNQLAFFKNIYIWLQILNNHAN